ncbi:hypothetical protein [Williamsia sterculiae]|uniref:Uncharacterized protein n=1 Tax=Williamsia sterculiae TaxID=1344003 RepID=A0A1N7GH09_9NOCA|nr:hypothetical protein [Williamsia sterculiae]SIS11877.1 hypothetical protein SAMN05445060_2775 [Williamsia sterculiae]
MILQLNEQEEQQLVTLVGTSYLHDESGQRAEAEIVAMIAAKVREQVEEQVGG